MAAPGVVGVVVAASLAVDWLALALVRRAVGSRTEVVARSVVRNIRRPAQFVVPLVAVEITLTSVRIDPRLRSDLLHGIGVALVLAVAFLAVRLTYVLDDVLLARYRIDVADNLRARRVHTQVQVLRRVTVVVVAVVALAVVLLSFPGVRAAGAGLLASAGLIGVVAGIAAKPTVANVVAGLQLAISQPIRVDDVVVVEGHWGRVEQIALTYVVVQVWDLRRLVLPISYFVENPFENWTRSTANVLGWVHLEVDYAAPVEELRAHLHQIVAASPDWDGNVWSLQVTGSGPTTMQLRALMSAPDSSRSWNLQCEVREKLIAHLRDHHPHALPRLRTVGTVAGPVQGTRVRRIHGHGEGSGTRSPGPEDAERTEAGGAGPGRWSGPAGAGPSPAG